MMWDQLPGRSLDLGGQFFFRMLHMVYAPFMFNYNLELTQIRRLSEKTQRTI